MIIFHTGAELFDKFNISVESEIIYSDYCKAMIFVHQHRIKFTDKALLIMDPARKRDDWVEADFIEFYPWENIIRFQNVSGSDITEEFSRSEIQQWLSTFSTPLLEYPFLLARRGNVAYVVKGTPKSERSKKGKKRLKQDVLERRGIIKKHFGAPFTGPVEIMVEIFSSDPEQLPDVDRISITIFE